MVGQTSGLVIATGHEGEDPPEENLAAAGHVFLLSSPSQPPCAVPGGTVNTVSGAPKADLCTLVC